MENYERKFTCPKCREKLLFMLDSARQDKPKLKELQRKFLILVRHGDWKVESKSVVYCHIDLGQGLCCYHLSTKDRAKYYGSKSVIKSDYFKLKQNYNCNQTILMLSQHYNRSQHTIKRLVFGR